jgi:glycosyltransferase involved in cell wall biosynthesis
MDHRPRVLLLIPHLGGGGAEKVIALLARHLSREKYELHLGLAAQSVAALARAPNLSLPPGIGIHALGASRVLFSTPRLLPLVRRLRPHLILCGIFHLSFLVLLLRPLFARPFRVTGVSVLIRHNSALNLGSDPFFTRLLYRTLYPRADTVICQSPAMARELARDLNIPPGRLMVLNNPIDLDSIRSVSGQTSDPMTAPTLPGPWPSLVAIGRLSREKGFDLLLEALPRIRLCFPAAGVAIAGTGPERLALEAQARRLGLSEAVRFTGALPEPATLFRAASVFVLSSRRDAMPNALLEAAAAGLPLVATPASAGLVELLRGQPGVWLAADTSAAALADALLLAFNQLAPGQRFPHPFIESFGIKRAIPAYEALIDQSLEASVAPSPTFRPCAGP